MVYILHFHQKRSDTLRDNILASAVTDREEEEKEEEDADESARIKVTDGMLSGYFRTVRVCRDRRD